MKSHYPLLVGFFIGVAGTLGYALGFWFLFAGYWYGLLMFYGGLFSLPGYMVFALVAPWIFGIKNRKLRRSWRWSALIVPLGMAALWFIANVG